MHRLVLIAACLLGLLVASQLGLPLLAERRLEDRLDRAGQVIRVDVEALPALKLLWGDADRVEVDLFRYESGRSSLAGLLSEAEGVATLRVSLARLLTSGLALRDVTLKKDGERLQAEAVVTRRALRAALPEGVELRPLAAIDGALLLEGSLTGLGLSARAALVAVAGRLLVRPLEGPLAALGEIVVFDDPRVIVEAVGARRHPQGFVLVAEGRLGPS